MGITVPFVYADWLAIYPEFTSPGGAIPVTQPQAENYFAQASLLHANDGSGPVCVAAQQTGLIYAVTAHLAALFAAPQGQSGPSTLVGRINSASEGSVSVGVQNDYPPGTAQYWQQTRYGAFYWEATKTFRTARYYPNNRSPVQPGIGGWGGVGAWNDNFGPYGGWNN